VLAHHTRRVTAPRERELEHAHLARRSDRKPTFEGPVECGELVGEADGRPRGRQRHAAAAFAATARWTRRRTTASPSPVKQFVKTNGRSARAARASRSMTCRSARTCGARSVLLITSRSEWVMPGPRLRGILSPSATSITKTK